MLTNIFINIFTDILINREILRTVHIDPKRLFGVETELTDLLGF